MALPQHVQKRETEGEGGSGTPGEVQAKGVPGEPDGGEGTGGKWKGKFEKEKDPRDQRRERTDTTLL